MVVTIPSSAEHGGYSGNLVTVEISDNCPICGQKRGSIYGTHSFDGSRRLNCDGWSNPCGHIDTYAAARKEGKPQRFKEPEPFGKKSLKN